jgi:hypothetical protein
MGKEITQGDGGPSQSGEQGVPGGGKGSVTDKGIHYTDHTTGESDTHSHNSWDERGGNVSNEHTTTGTNKDKDSAKSDGGDEEQSDEA